jgi:hypothetical protein
LEALGSIGAAQDHESTSRTDAWARSIPFGRGPNSEAGEGMNISGSPPAGAPNLGRGGFTPASPPRSPPQRMVRPVSQNNVYGKTGESRDRSRDKSQRHSFGAQNSQYPPLPHLPQAHFYGAPGIDVGVLPRPHAREPPDASHAFQAIDNLPMSGYSSMRQPGKAILIGGDGRLQVLSVENERLKVIGRLEGLGGTVVDAKLLPWTSRSDPFDFMRPLVAVTVHGLAEESTSDDNQASEDTADTVLDQSEALPIVSSRLSASGNSQRGDGIPKYQTRVEVHSLANNTRIAVLFATRPVATVEDYSFSYMMTPTPTRELKLHAQNNFVIVSSGTSGEVFVFGIESTAEGNQFQCLGKVWTTVQKDDSRRYSTSSNSTDTEGSPVGSPQATPAANTPLMSLSGRWLAVVPPTPSARFSLYGTVPYSLNQKKRPGLDSHTSNSKPNVTCVIDTPEPESLLNKVAREVTQELVKGARWLGDQGLQTWRNYWSRDSSSGSTPNRSIRHSDPPQSAPFFPPTHATDNNTSPSTSEPEIVSIYDLRRFEESQDAKTALVPIATFQPPNGCSFISFAPNGLSILTASKKGDVQHVWDLMQMVHGRAGSLMTEASGSGSNSFAVRVRQIAKYERLSPSQIIDVVWTNPIGDRLAILTKKGTIHLFDLPLSAFQWPPFRRVVRPTAASGDQVEVVSEEPTTTSNPFAAAMNMVGGRTQPILAAVRGRAPSMGNTFSSTGGLAMGSSTGIKAGKAVAAGLSKSAGAATSTVSNIRHAGENRLHLSGLARSPSPSHVVWFDQGEDSSIGLIDGSAFKLYKVRRSAIPNKGTRRRASIFSSKTVEIRLPSTFEGPKSFVATGDLRKDPVRYDQRSTSSVLGQPNLNSTGAPMNHASSHPLSQAEIETNPPYQPFHTDRRVNLHIFFSDSKPGYPELSTDPWVFGDEIPSTKLHVWDSLHGSDNHSLQDGPGFNAQVENLISLGEPAEDGHVEQVVVTSRRRKVHAPGTDSVARLPDDDGFFEDDCDVVDFADDRV